MQIIPKSNRRNIVIKIIFGITSFSLSSMSLASGFQLQEQSSLYLGTAYSGTAAWAADASSAFYNPAALTHIKNKQVVLSNILINSNAAFTASSTNIPFQPGISVPASQTDNANPGGLSLIPSIQYAARVNPNLVFGLSIAAPFGLSTDYDPKGIMRYVATYSELITLDVSPSFAYKATDWLSLGAGLDVLYAQAILDAQTTLATLGDIEKDGFQKNRASDWALGWHAGFLMDLCHNTRVGLNYRSKYNLNTKGVSQQLAPITLFSPSQSGEFLIRPAHADLVLPETLVLSAYHDLNRSWAIMADASWTAWSRLQTIGLRFEPLPNDVPNSIITATNTDTDLSFKDTFKLGFGVNYTYNNRWQFRAGTAYDQSPVKGTETRTARLPDSNRIWLALGASYTCAQLRVDLGYAHLFLKDAELSDNGPFRAGTDEPVLPFNNVSGKYFSYVDILGIQLRYDFV